jgi:transcriptional regulator with PAS, ATPase and Fis domain
MDYKYNVGDKVIPNKNAHDSDVKEKREMIGKICEIKSMPDIDQEYKVYTPDKEDYWWFHEDQLDPVEKTEPESASEAFEWKVTEILSSPRSSGKASEISRVLASLKGTTGTTSVRVSEEEPITKTTTKKAPTMSKIIKKIGTSYVDEGNYNIIKKCVEIKESVLLIGETGTGKTTIIRELERINWSRGNYW